MWFFSKKNQEKANETRDKSCTTSEKENTANPRNLSPRMVALLERIDYVYKKYEASNIPKKSIRFYNGC